ncbi:MAG TPA: hypothetical protein DIT89_13595 [Planctomycetaceae bacterium]|nr:hypothetical protein [Planctomycetaceae bacterium]
MAGVAAQQELRPPEGGAGAARGVVEAPAERKGRFLACPGLRLSRSFALPMGRKSTAREGKAPFDA